MPNPSPAPAQPQKRKSKSWIWITLLILLLLALGWYLFNYFQMQEEPTPKPEYSVANYGNFELVDTSVLPVGRNNRQGLQPGDDEYGVSYDRIQYFPLSNGNILMYINTFQELPGSGTFVKPQTNHLATFDIKSHQISLMDEIKITNPYHSTALLLDDNKLLVAGANNYIESGDDTSYPSLDLIIYNLENNSSQTVSFTNSNTHISKHPYLVQTKDKVLIGTYQTDTVGEDVFARRTIHSVVYQLNPDSQTISQLNDIELPRSYEPSSSQGITLQLDDRQSLISTDGNLYLLNHQKSSTTFMRKIGKPVSMYTIGDSNLVWMQYDHVLTPDSIIGIYNQKTNQLFTREMGQLPVAQKNIKFEQINGIPRAGDDGKPIIRLEDNTSPTFQTVPLADGTILLTGATSSHIPWPFGLIEPSTFSWMNSETDISAEYDYTNNYGSNQDIDELKSLAPQVQPIQLSNGEVLLANSLAPWTVYTPSDRNTADQNQAKSQLTSSSSPLNSNQDSTWETGKNHITVAANQGELIAQAVYPLRGNEVLIIHPDRNQSVLGQVYNPKSGSTRIITSKLLAANQLPDFKNGIRDNFGNIHFFGNGEVYIFNAKSKKLTRKQGADLSGGGYYAVVDNKIIFVNYQFSSRTVNTPFGGISSGVTLNANSQAGLKVYDVNNQSVKFINAGNSNLDGFTSGAGKLIVQGASNHRIVISYGNQLKIYNYKTQKLEQELSSTLITQIDSLMPLVDGNLLLVGKDNLELVNLQSLQLQSIGTVENPQFTGDPLFTLPGNQILVADSTNRLFIYDLATGHVIPTAQPLVTTDRLVQLNNAEVVSIPRIGNLPNNDLANDPTNPPLDDNIYSEPLRPVISSDYYTEGTATSTPYATYAYALEPGGTEIYTPASGEWFGPLGIGSFSYTPINNIWLWFLYLQLAQVIAGGIILTLEVLKWYRRHHLIKTNA